MSDAYNDFCLLLGTGQLDLRSPGSDVRALLVTSSYTFNRDHDRVSEVVAAELTASGGSNYVRKVLQNKSFTELESTDECVFDADDVTWSSLGAGGGLPAAAILFKQVTNDADSPLLVYLNLTGSSPVGTDYIVSWDAAGILSVLIP